MLNFKKSALAAIIAGLASTQTFAIEPAPIKVGEANFTPTLDVNMTADDNIRAREDIVNGQSNKQSATVTAIVPKFVLGAESRNTAYQLEYGANHRKYDGADVGDLTDHNLAARGLFDFDVRNRLKLEGTMDRRESIENLLNRTNTIDRIATNRLGAQYFYGAPQATFNVEAGVNQTQLRSIDSNVNQNIERDTTGMNASLLYRISPITQLELEGRLANTSYVTAKTNDNDQRTILAGARWEITGSTAGRAKIGSETKSFTNTNRADANRPSWEVAIDWQPVDRAKLTLLTQQATQEGALGFAYIETARHSVSWEHAWTQLFKSTVSYARVAEDFANSDVDPNRSDLSNQSSVMFNYSLSRWMDLQGGYIYSDRDSIADYRHYSRNQWRLGLSMSL